MQTFLQPNVFLELFTRDNDPVFFFFFLSVFSGLVFLSFANVSPNFHVSIIYVTLSICVLAAGV